MNGPGPGREREGTGGNSAGTLGGWRELGGNWAGTRRELGGNLGTKWRKTAETGRTLPAEIAGSPSFRTKNT